MQTPSWDLQSGVGEFRRLGNTFEDEMPAAASVISQLSVHTGTHIDAPSHFVKEYFDRGLGIESLDLGTLNGAHSLKRCACFLATLSWIVFLLDLHN